MNPELGPDLEKYSKFAKAEIDAEKKVASGELTEEEAQQSSNNLVAELDSYIEARVATFDTSSETQQSIYEFQKIKQRIMEQLHEDFRHLDDEAYLNDRFGNSTTVRTGEDGQFYVDKDGKQEPIKDEELFTDGEWGVQYNIASNSIAREVKKRYLVESAKQELRALLDKQIYEFETGMSIQDDMKRDAYEAVMDEREGELTPGHIIEKIVRNYFKKLEFTSDLSLEIIDTNLYQDIEQKIDFIIHRKEHLRGVKTEVNSDLHSYGIQFTTNTNPEVLGRKMKQLERVRQSLGGTEAIEDLTLVQMSSDLSQNLFEMYKYWKDHGKKPGGPDKFLSAQLQEQLFRNLLSGILSEQDIDEQWQLTQKPKSENLNM